MSEPALLGLYWGARQRPIEDCADRAHESLRALHALGYERYFRLGKSRKDARKQPFVVTPDAVRAALGKGANYADIPRRAIPELGWRMSLWSGDPTDECYSVSFQVGAYSPYVGNNVLVELPPAGPFRLDASPERARAAFDALVRIWSPEEGVLCAKSAFGRDEQGKIVLARPPLAQLKRNAEPGKDAD
jgi:hypothetical protein